MCLGSFDRAICLRPRFMPQERCPGTAGFANVNHPRTLRMQYRHVHHHVPLECDREENHRAAPIADFDTHADPHTDGHTEHCGVTIANQCRVSVAHCTTANRHATAIAHCVAKSGRGDHSYADSNVSSAERNHRADCCARGATTNRTGQLISARHARRGNWRISRRRRLGWRRRVDCSRVVYAPGAEVDQVSVELTKNAV